MSSGLRELFKHLEEERANRAWYEKLRDFFRYQVFGYHWSILRSVPSHVINVYQRARYGFGHRDLWSFDQYLTRMLSKATSDLADVAHGYPGTPEFPTFESWIRFLRELSYDFAQYSDDYLCDVDSVDDIFDRIEELGEREERNYRRGTDAMRRFSENLGSMWD